VTRRRTTGDEPALALRPDDGLPVSDEDLEAAADRGTASSAAGGGASAFRIDDDLFPDTAAAAEAGPAGNAPLFLESFGGGESSPALPDPDGPGLLLEDEGAGWDCGPIVERHEEVPERFWAPEVAGLGRRGVALLIDQTVLGALLGVFFLAACAALRLSGFAADALFAAAALQAVLPPFALLAVLLSLVYHCFFHGRDGRTPGKALAGVAVRTGDGAVPSLGRCVLRWFAAALGLGCAGAGIVWAFFHPRRRGWADLLSQTLVAECRRASSGQPDSLPAPR